MNNSDNKHSTTPPPVVTASFPKTREELDNMYRNNDLPVATAVQAEPNFVYTKEPKQFQTTQATPAIATPVTEEDDARVLQQRALPLPQDTKSNTL